MPLAIALLLLLATSPLVILLLRANELFSLRLHGGRVRIVRGRIPRQLLDDIEDVLRRGGVAEGTLRGVSEDGRVRLHAQAELTEGQRQQLRNVVGRWSVTQVRNAPRPR
jgi:hypothetical protein